MQPEPTLSQEPQAPKKFNFMIVVVVVLILALAGVGYWGFQQSSALKATQAELSALQGDYDSLTTEKNTLSSNLDSATSDLDATKTDLEAAKAELETAKSDLSKAQSAASATQAKIGKASKLAEILYAISTVKTPTDLMAVDTSVKALKDTAVLAEWTKFLSAPTVENSTNFLLYLITSIQKELK